MASGAQSLVLQESAQLPDSFASTVKKLDSILQTQEAEVDKKENSKSASERMPAGRESMQQPSAKSKAAGAQGSTKKQQTDTGSGSGLQSQSGLSGQGKAIGKGAKAGAKSTANL